ncbi:MAG: small multi-drug export protein [Candidatus Altimarinota bacterium]
MSLELFATIAFSSMVPVTELQAAIPLFMATQPQLPIWFVYSAAVLGSMVPPAILVWLLPKTNDWIHDCLAPELNKWVRKLHRFFIDGKRGHWYFTFLFLLIFCIEYVLYQHNVSAWYWYVIPVVLIGLFGFLFAKSFLQAHKSALENSSIIHWFYKTVHEQHSEKFNRWGSLVLIILTGIPFAMPGAGVWTASVVAFLFNIPYRRAIISILIGVLCSAAIVTAVASGIITGMGLQ